jgi:hypothetical protein
MWRVFLLALQNIAKVDSGPFEDEKKSGRQDIRTSTVDRTDNHHSRARVY